MKSKLHLSFLWLGLFITSIDLVPAQQIHTDKMAPATTDRKWSVSFSLGATISSRRNGMIEAMNDEGFNDWYTELYTFFGLGYTSVTKYPKDRIKGLGWDMEVRRKLTPDASVALTYSRQPAMVTDGHNEYGNELHHFLSLQTRFSVITCDYIFTKKNSYTGFKIGPALAIHQVSDLYAGTDPEKVTTVKPGLHLGLDAALFEKKSWFMAFSLDYTWMTKVSVGPYSKEATVLEEGESVTYTSVFDPVKVPLSFLKIGIRTGWKF